MNIIDCPNCGKKTYQSFIKNGKCLVYHYNDKWNEGCGFKESDKLYQFMAESMIWKSKKEKNNGNDAE